MSILYAWILILSFSLTIAVSLDGNCSNNTSCDGKDSMVCQGGKCQCNIPWYKPCNSSCDINRDFVYAGDECRVEENCIGNTICRENKCQCIPNYTAKNGVCFKSLNSVCTNDTECWSNYCLNSLCKCGPGYELINNSTDCRRKLVNIYKTWNEANVANALCIDAGSCIDVLAECYHDPANPSSKFCKCPIGYNTIENKKCEIVESELLSPLDSKPDNNNYGECGYCKDDNAACISAANQRTCWCRSGYVKRNNKCEKVQKLLIFPNLMDIELNDFTSDCSSYPNGTNEIKNKLCVCSPGYKFINKNAPCEKIPRDWIDNVHEYGLCTQINSRDEAISQNGLCPEPLKCEANNDKYVCSCGKDKFRDLDDPTQCVYYIGRIANTTHGCPKNAVRNNRSICECEIGYKVTNGGRQCEIKLSSEPFQSSCNFNRSSNTICQNLFGNTSQLCDIGECRCSGNESYPNKEQTHCYSRVNQILVSPMADCPEHSNLTSNRCECDDGYHPSNDLRECVRWNAELIEYQGPSRNTNGTLTTKICQGLFKGPVEVYEGDRCQCQNNSFINDDKNGCWYQLGVTLSPKDNTTFCPPNTTITNDPQCICHGAYIQENRKCVPVANQVYIDNDATAQSTSGITENDCVYLFGQGATKSNNGYYCICRPEAYPAESNTYCYFLINIMGPLSRSPRTCPANTNIASSGDNSTCECKPGYHVSADSRTCVETIDIDLVGVLDMQGSNSTNCVNFTNDDCIVKYGEQAFCKDQKCYCNRRLSFMNTNKKCESFSSYVFPGEHELDLYSCSTDKDCGDNNGKVICDYFDFNSGYKVCKCKDGSLLDPRSQTCVENRCVNCNEADNFECRNYQCVCKSGYYLNGSMCVEYTRKLELYQSCDQTIFREIDPNSLLVCDGTCQRAQCKIGYRAENTNCVRYELNKDKCVHQEEICPLTNPNSFCSKDENQCLCKPSYYRSNNTCVRVVGAACNNNEECGSNMECKGKRCACNAPQRIEESQDNNGRPIQICVNGIDQIRFSPVLLLFYILARVFFI